MRSGPIEAWLKHKARQERRVNLVAALGAAMLALPIFGLLVAGCYPLWGMGYRGLELAVASAGWELPSWAGFLPTGCLFVALMITLLFVANARYPDPGNGSSRAGTVTGPAWVAMAGGPLEERIQSDLVFCGPRLALTAWYFWRRSRAWRRLDLPLTAQVLQLLATRRSAVSLREMERLASPHELREVVQQLLEIPGVILLSWNPITLVLTFDLRSELRQAAGMGRQARASERAGTHDRRDFRRPTDSEPVTPPTARELQCYRTLGLTPDAPFDDIRAAYRRLIKQYHPDRMGQADARARHWAERRAREIIEAYHTLKARRKPLQAP